MCLRTLISFVSRALKYFFWFTNVFYFISDQFPQCLKISTEKKDWKIYSTATCAVWPHITILSTQTWFSPLGKCCLAYAILNLQKVEIKPIQADGKAAVSKGEEWEGSVRELGWISECHPALWNILLWVKNKTLALSLLPQQQAQPWGCFFVPCCPACAGSFKYFGQSWQAPDGWDGTFQKSQIII